MCQPSLHLISPFNNLAERKPIKVVMLAMTYENVQCQLLSGKYIVNIQWRVKWVTVWTIFYCMMNDYLNFKLQLYDTLLFQHEVHVLHTHQVFHTFLALVLHLFLLHWKGDLEHLQLNLSKSQIGFLMWCTASCRDGTKQKHITLQRTENSVPMQGFFGEPIKIYFLIWNYSYMELLRECFGNPWGQLQYYVVKLTQTQNIIAKMPGLTSSWQYKVKYTWFVSYRLDEG